MVKPYKKKFFFLLEPVACLRAFYAIMKPKRRKPDPPRRMPLADEILDTEKKDQHETLEIRVRILRSLYLHCLHACRDGDYKSPGDYVADLIRRDKHIKNLKPPGLEAPLHQPTPVVEPPHDEPKRLGFEREFNPIFGRIAAGF